MKNNIITFYLILISMSISYGQTRLTKKEYEFFKKIPQENIYVHHNNNLLLTGETLYYKVYCSIDSTNVLSRLSKIAYVEIVNRKKEVVLHQKIRLTKGVGQGDFFIPSNLPSDVYKLIVYTQWMKNKNAFYKDDLFIVNPFLTDVPLKLAERNDTTNQGTFRNYNNLISPNKTSFSKREKVTLKINAQREDILDGNYSISVKAKNPLFHIIPNSGKKQNPTVRNSRTVFLPELRGEMIHGRIISNNENRRLSTGDIRIALSITQKGGITKMTNTNAIGQFYFNLHENYTGETAFIEVLDKGDYQIELVKDTPINYDHLSFPTFFLDSTSIESLSKRTTYLQIENAYSSKKNDSVNELTPYTPSILKSMELTYDLDDYTRFNTLKETFIEVIVHAWIEKKEDQHSFMARLPENEYLDPKALLIIDGYIVKDHNSIIDYNPRKIKRISVLKRPYRLNTKFFEGVIYMETKNGDYIPKEDTGIMNYKLSKPTNLKKYFSPNYENKSFERIPDYRTQLLWQPNLNLKEKEVSFYTSDVKGTYEIVLKGYSKNGIYITTKQSFIVE